MAGRGADLGFFQRAVVPARTTSPLRRASLFVCLLLAGQAVAPGQGFQWSGSIRYYQFFRFENPSIDPSLLPRRDSEFSSLRFKFESPVGSRARIEVQPVLDLLSPPASSSQNLVTGGGGDWLGLQQDWNRGRDPALGGRFDRLVLTLELKPVRIEIGRQAITWGVTYFWPSMDLFSNFAPQRVDREYKAGVDAVRATIPIGSYSELQLVGAVLGSSYHDDKTAAALLRLHLGRIDLGMMGGSFHGDAVGGLFATSDLAGTSLRAELTWTRAGEAGDAAPGRPSFWKASAGIDRQLHQEWTLTLEWAFNGFGVDRADRYGALLLTDRVRRGEVNALGRHYLGSGLVWQLHPLWTLTQSVLVNMQDPSLLWIPALEWSTGDNSSVLFGFQNGFGGGVRPDLSLQSEYGAIPATLFASVRFYF